MAFSANTERGTATDTTSDTTVAVTPSGNITVGKIAWVFAVTDNTQTTAGASTDHTSVTDTDGHTWNKVWERTQSVGAAGDGTTASLWWTKVTTQIDTTDAVTLTIGTARAAKLLILWEVTVDSGNTIQQSATGVSVTFREASTSTSNSIATSGMTSKEYYHLGTWGREDTTATWTEDADYTNVLAAEGITIGGGLGAQASNVGYRIATLTGDVFLATIGSGRDSAIAITAFEEVTPGGVAQDPYPYVGGGYYPTEG